MGWERRQGGLAHAQRHRHGLADVQGPVEGQSAQAVGVEVVRRQEWLRAQERRLINAGSRGFGWSFALRGGPVHGLSPDGAVWPVDLHRSEFLQRALLIGEEESKQRFPLQKDDQGGYQEADQGDQDCHSNDHAVGCQPHWPTVNAPTEAALLTERRGPVCFTVAVVLVVAHPTSTALPRALMHIEDTDILALPIQAHHAVATLCTSQNQSRVRHVIPQVHMCPSTQNTPSFLQRDVGFNGNGICSDHWPVSSSLALNFTTFCIPRITFGKGAFGVLPTVPVRIPC